MQGDKTPVTEELLGAYGFKRPTLDILSGCNAKAKQMDDWGVEGCELPENFETIKGWIADGVWSKLDFSVILASFTTGLALEINPLHPIDSMVRLCIKRAREARDKKAA